MRTETIIREWYTFDELSDEAKERARMWYCEGIEYDFSDDQASLTAFAEAAGFKVIECELGAMSGRLRSPRLETHYHGPLLVDGDGGDIQDETGEYWEGFAERLETCEMTGYWADGCFAPAIREALGDTEATFSATMQAAVQAFQDDVAKEIEAQYEDANVDEMIVANGYEFLANGSRS